jgi:hypothetical protein
MKIIYIYLFIKNYKKKKKLHIFIIIFITLTNIFNFSQLYTISKQHIPKPD